MVSDDAARQFIADSKFVWFQGFHLTDAVVTPGEHDVEGLLDRVGFPQSLEGESLLDIGTSNGGCSFIAERRGAGRVVAVDFLDENHFGFGAIRTLVGSSAEFVQASVYELPEVQPQQFDIVLFLGVLYHLRHPLLALDCVRRLTKGTVYIESAVSGQSSDPPRAVFFRRDELGSDGSNWFAPSVSCLVDWVESCGFAVDRVTQWPPEWPARAALVAHPTPGDPEYMRWSYEVPISASVSRRAAPE